MLGVDAHRDEIDAMIRKYSEHWALERMPVIDRALLRLGTYELGWMPDVPTAAVDHRGGRAREAVLDEGLGPVRERVAVAHRGVRAPERMSPDVVTIERDADTETITVPDTIEELLGDERTDRRRRGS